MKFDLISPRKYEVNGESKTYWHQVGSAFDAKSGGYRLKFNSLPLPDEKGEVVVLMREAKPRQSSEPARGDDLDSEIPF